MRAGGYTVHQSLTAEAAAVLKMALGLACSRGHAQVTPLHVAFTLLSTSAASSSPPSTFAASPCAYGLLRRACAKAYPGAGAVSPHPAQCRALELCFNVALNRLPTTNATGGSPMSSSSSAGSGASSTPFAVSLVQSNPTLSNALVAALKRAQASQRRGCVELQNQPPPTPQQQQPLLTIKVELDQLIVSILDDPSVSRVMREAGFSSAAIKTYLEEESAMLLSLGHSSSTLSPTSAPAVTVPPDEYFLEAHGGLFPTHAGGFGGGALWAAQFLSHPEAEFESPCKDEDVRAILEVMSRKQGRRSNPVVVGDSVFAAEASVSELMRRLEGGDVPDELRGAHVLRLHFSHVHVRLMTRVDVDAWVGDLRRTVAACTNAKFALVIYVGDMRWAVDEARAAPRYSPAEHMAAALARLLGELRASGRAWLVAAASYETYMRCQRRLLDATWALQPVPTPAGAGLGLGLALGPRAASPKDGKIGRLAQFPLLDSGPKQEDGVAALCVECARNLEREASAARAKAEGTNLALSCFPGWPQADEPQISQMVDVMDLKRKWSGLCQRRAHLRHNQQPDRPSTVKSSHPTGLCLSLRLPCHGTTSNKVRHRDVETTEETSSDEIHRRRRGNDGKPEVQEGLDLIGSKSRDEKSVVPWFFDEPPSGDRKRRALRTPSEPKCRRGSAGLDLNLCAEEEEGGSGDESVPSDLTNDGQGSSGDVSDSRS